MIKAKLSFILDFSHGTFKFHPSNPHLLPTTLTFSTSIVDFFNLILVFRRLNPFFSMQIMNFFRTIQHFFTANAHFFGTNTHFSITNPFFSPLIAHFFRLIAYFFPTIVHFSILIEYCYLVNPLIPATRDRMQT